jgi:hypothetical protein
MKNHQVAKNLIRVGAITPRYAMTVSEGSGVVVIIELEHYHLNDYDHRKGK